MTFKTLALASTMLTGLTGLVSAEELRFDDVFVIGDSLSDAGAYSQSVIAGGMGALPVINYKFLTNAPDGSSLTYGEVLGRELGLNLGPNVYSGVPLAGQGEVALGETVPAARRGLHPVAGEEGVGLFRADALVPESAGKRVVALIKGGALPLTIALCINQTRGLCPEPRATAILIAAAIQAIANSRIDRPQGTIY